MPGIFDAISSPYREELIESMQGDMNGGKKDGKDSSPSKRPLEEAGAEHQGKRVKAEG